MCLIGIAEAPREVGKIGIGRSEQRGGGRLKASTLDESLRIQSGVPLHKPVQCAGRHAELVGECRDMQNVRPLLH